MLDYDKLGKEVDALIDKVSKDDFEKWLIKDDLRMRQAFLEDGYAYKFDSPAQRIVPHSKIILEKTRQCAGFLLKDFF